MPTRLNCRVHPHAYATYLLCAPTCIRACLPMCVGGWALSRAQLADEETHVRLRTYLPMCRCNPHILMHPHTHALALTGFGTLPNGHEFTENSTKASRVHKLLYHPAKGWIGTLPNRHGFKFQKFFLGFFLKNTKNTCISILGRV